MGKTAEESEGRETDGGAEVAGEMVNGNKLPSTEDDAEEKRVEKTSDDEDDEDEDGEEDEENNSHLPIDRGWAWMIVLACFINATVVAGYGRALAVLFVEFLQKFQASTAMTTLIYGVMAGVYSFSAFIVLNLMVTFITIRKTVLTGTVLTFIGVLSTAFANDIRTLICLQSIFIGIGHSMIVGPGIVLVGQYFHKRRALAISLANSGVSFGAITMPALVRYLLDEYGLQGSYIILAAIQLHLLISVSLSRPLESYEKKLKAPMEAAESVESVKDLHAHLRPLLSRQCSRASKGRSISVTSAGSVSPDQKKEGSLSHQTSLCSTEGELGHRAPCHDPLVQRQTETDEMERNPPSPGRKEKSFECVIDPRLNVLSEEEAQDCDVIKEGTCCKEDEEPKTTNCNDPDEEESKYCTKNENEKTLSMPVTENREENSSISKNTEGGHTTTSRTMFRQVSEMAPRHIDDRDVDEVFHAADSLRKSSFQAFSAPNVHRLTREEARNQSPGVLRRRGLELVRVVEVSSPGTPRRRRKRTTSESSAWSVNLSELMDTLSQASIPRPACNLEPMSSSCLDINNPTVSASMHSLAVEREAELEPELTEEVSSLGKLRLLLRALVKAIDLSMFKHPLFLLISCYSTLGIMLSATLAYVPALAVAHGIDERRAAFMLSLVGVIDFFSRLGLGVVANLGCVRTSTLMATGLLMAGTLLHFTRFYTTFPLFVTFVVLFGLVGSSYNVLCTVLIVDLVGRENNAKALGLVSLLHGMAGAVGHPIIGSLRDITGNYAAGFHFLGACAYVTSALLFLVTYIKRRMDQKGKARKKYTFEEDIEAATPMKSEEREVTRLPSDSLRLEVEQVKNDEEETET